jgi:D-alanyl-D-alanine carboxypeptidase
VRAKTGTIIGGAALSGFGTTVGGRAFVVSVVINGPGADASADAIDALVAAWRVRRLTTVSEADGLSRTRLPSQSAL